MAKKAKHKNKLHVVVVLGAIFGAAALGTMLYSAMSGHEPSYCLPGYTYSDGECYPLSEDTLCSSTADCMFVYCPSELMQAACIANECICIF